MILYTIGLMLVTMIKLSFLLKLNNTDKCNYDRLTESLREQRQTVADLAIITIVLLTVDAIGLTTKP